MKNPFKARSFQNFNPRSHIWQFSSEIKGVYQMSEHQWAYYFILNLLKSIKSIQQLRKKEKNFNSMFQFGIFLIVMRICETGYLESYTIETLKWPTAHVSRNPKNSARNCNHWSAMIKDFSRSKILKINVKKRVSYSLLPYYKKMIRMKSFQQSMNQWIQYIEKIDFSYQRLK